MGNQCGNLLKLWMSKFNITFWLQIFKIRNVRNVYFHYLNIQKFKQFLFCQFFKKWQWFWLKCGFLQYFNWINFRNFTFLGEYLSWEKFEIVHLLKFILQSFSYFSLNFYYHLKFFKDFMILKSLSCKIFYITQFAKVYTKTFEFLSWWKFL